MSTARSRYRDYSYSRKQKHRARFGKNEAILLALLGSLLAGTILGCLYVNITAPDSFQNISDEIFKYLHSIVVMETNNADIFIEGVIKYGKIVVFIWILAFLPQASPLTLLLILYKGLGCGFTAAALLRIYGLDGLRMALFSFIPQNLLLIPAYIFVAYAGFRFMFSNLHHPKYDDAPSKRHIKISYQELLTASVRFENQTLLEYGAILLAGMVCVCLAVLLEIYIMPGLLHRIL